MTLEELFADIEGYRKGGDQMNRIVGRSLYPEPEPRWWWMLDGHVRGTLSMIECWLVEELGWFRSSYLDLSNDQDNPLIKRRYKWKPTVLGSGAVLGDPICHHWIVDMMSGQANPYQFHMLRIPADGDIHLWTDTKLHIWLTWGIYQSRGSFGEGFLLESLANWKQLVSKMLSLEELPVDGLWL
jgi:hypothetical protein